MLNQSAPFLAIFRIFVDFSDFKIQSASISDALCRLQGVPSFHMLVTLVESFSGKQISIHQFIGTNQQISSTVMEQSERLQYLPLHYALNQ